MKVLWHWLMGARKPWNQSVSAMMSEQCADFRGIAQISSKRLDRDDLLFASQNSSGAPPIEMFLLFYRFNSVHRKPWMPWSSRRRIRANLPWASASSCPTESASTRSRSRPPSSWGSSSLPASLICGRRKNSSRQQPALLAKYRKCHPGLFFSFLFENWSVNFGNKSSRGRFTW